MNTVSCVWYVSMSFCQPNQSANTTGELPSLRFMRACMCIHSYDTDHNIQSTNIQPYNLYWLTNTKSMRMETIQHQHVQLQIAGESKRSESLHFQQNKCNKHISIELRTDKLIPLHHSGLSSFGRLPHIKFCLLGWNMEFIAEFDYRMGVKRQQCNYLNNIRVYTNHNMLPIYYSSQSFRLH